MSYTARRLLYIATLVVSVPMTLATAVPAQQAQEAKAAVVSTSYLRPHAVRVIKTAFQPWGQPTPAQVSTIIAVEAARAGVAPGALTHRIQCESGFRWSATNGQYTGLGQFASGTFYRGMSSIGSRKVKLVERRTRAKFVHRVELLSDGTYRYVRAWRIRQRVIHIYMGMIPRVPPTWHGWAQVRIMAQAIAGHSAVNNSEWQCST